MKTIWEQIKDFLKKEAVLCTALLLAAVSAFIVPPDRDYAEYIDFQTLAILFCLMSVMAGLRKAGVFEGIAYRLLKKVKTERSIVLILVLLCFFFSMVITNDVALITFVPFTFTVLRLLGEERKKRLVLPVVVLQTIAANLGSMLTPIGNPQNLYLYGKAGISMGEFVLLMLPYTLLSLGMLLVCCVLMGGKGRGRGVEGRKRSSRQEKAEMHDWENAQTRDAAGGLQRRTETESGEKKSDRTGRAANRKYVALHFVLFAICLLTVAHILPWQAALVTVFGAVLLLDRSVLGKVDYSLLLTFVGFFIFIGNMGRIPVFREFLQSMITGNEVYTAIAASQVISNVPAALLLSGFTENYAGLIVGTNLGGLGTLIASMASLISYKYVAKEEGERKGAYIGLFTAANVCFLLALVLLFAMKVPGGSCG